MKIAILANLKEDITLFRGNLPKVDYLSELDDKTTVQAIENALCSQGHQAKYIKPDLKIIDRLLEYKPDLCFNFCEGFYGRSRDAQIPAILDMLRIPFSGSGVMGMSLSHNKHLAKKMFHLAGLPTPEYVLVTDHANIPDINIVYPLFIKPAHEGSSIGINKNSRVENMSALIDQVAWLWEKVHQPLIIEKYIEGREFTISILGDEVLPIAEITTPTGYYTFQHKTADKLHGISRVCPAKINREKEQELERIALNAMQELEVLDWCRVDIRMDSDENLYILEVNPTPAIYPPPEPCSFMQSVYAAGYSYDEMVNKIVLSAANRLNL